MLNIDVAIAAPAWGDLVEDAAGRAEAAVRAAISASCHAALATDDGEVEVSVVLDDDAAMAALNQRYRDKVGPTNVLSFGGADPVPRATIAGGPPVALGDIVLALQTVASEAADQGKTVADHMTHLTVHGCLHLLGYDHDSAADAAVMEDIERRVLAGLGVADPYGGEAPAATGA